MKGQNSINVCYAEMNKMVQLALDCQFIRSPGTVTKVIHEPMHNRFTIHLAELEGEDDES